MNGGWMMHQSSMEEESGAATYRNVGLVLGGTGIVGSSLVRLLPGADTPGGPWKVYAIARRPHLPWNPTDLPVNYIQCDLSDAADARAKLSHLSDVTHAFYVAWSLRATDDETRELNTRMLRNALSALLPACPRLRHICLQTGRRHYFAYDHRGLIACHDRPFHEALPRLSEPAFYYDLEDVLLDAADRSGGRLTWSVHRPGLIFGFSPYTPMNIVGTLCVYAAICRHEGEPLRFPGDREAWEGRYSDASDAGLVAEQQVWAAVEPRAKNEAFNCSNGDVFMWKVLWTALAGRFGLEARGYVGEEGRFLLAEAMAGKEAVWDAVVAAEGLESTKVQEVANWWFADACLNHDLFLDTMTKSRRHGFFGFRDSVDSFVAWIDVAKSHKIVP